MLVYAKKYLTPTSIRVVDSQFNTIDFATIRASDLSANGRIKPVAARHFAEKAERIQNLNNFAASPLYQDPAINVHFSGLKMAKMMSEELDLEEWDLVQPFVRLSENAQATQQQNSYDENTMAQIETPSGLTPDDFSDPANDTLA
jgi:hypothetical protein